MMRLTLAALCLAAASGAAPGPTAGRIGRVQLEATPVFRTIFEVEPEWKMYQLKCVANRDYGSRALNAALHLDLAKQVLDIGPVYVLDYGQDPR